MPRIFISGSSTGLGLMAGQLLAEQGNAVALHARNTARAAEIEKILPQAAIVTGDLATIAGARSVAEQVNALGRFDAVIHNAAVGYQEPERAVTADNLPLVFAVNTLSVYILTALIARPRRLIYLSSGLHRGAGADFTDILWEKRRWNGAAAYSESKLHDAMLAFAIARRWPETRANAVEPGWVPTRMGGAGAPDDLDQAHRTQAWLAADPAATQSGGYLFHMRPKATNRLASDVQLQDRLIDICAGLSGIPLP